MQYHHYIIVGAGPAGLQMGYFLGQAGRDYLILEATETAGAFFTNFPRHRTLISINKRFNFFPEPDFNMRHDWNSLLTEDNGLLFRNYSEELFPPADAIVRYSRDFAAKYALKIQYHTRIRYIDQEKGGSRRFILTDAQGKQYACARLLMATGAIGPRVPDVKGIELAEGYEVHDIDPKRFENKRVLIMGRGNSAFEVANHLASHAAIIHVAVNNQPVKHAWQTHFVGDLRAINNTILDMVQLKSLHFVVGFQVEAIERQADGTLLVRTVEELPHWETPGTIRIHHVYDHVIRCTGWKYMDPALFAPEICPRMDQKGKYPLVNPSWESTTPDLYFIGTASAGNDRKAASGFIHGFRYNIRTLFHLLEEKDAGKVLPSQTFPLQTVDDLSDVADDALRRLSTTDGLFQLYSVLCDAWVFGDGEVRIVRELPVNYVLQRPDFTAGKHLITMTLEYGFQHYPAHAPSTDFISVADEGADRACAAFIHPVFRHYFDNKLIEESHLGESLVVRYGVHRGTYGGRLKGNVHKNILMNLINKVARITPEVFSEQLHRGDAFTPWTTERPVNGRPVWKCAIPGNGHEAEKQMQAEVMST